MYYIANVKYPNGRIKKWCESGASPADAAKNILAAAKAKDLEIEVLDTPRPAHGSHQVVNARAVKNGQ